MHRKEKYQVLSVRFGVLTVLLFLSHLANAAHNKTPHSGSARTNIHGSEHRRSPGASSETIQTKRSDVKRPLSKIDGNVYTVANIEQLNTVHSVLVNPAFTTHKDTTITQGTARVTPIQAKSLISQNTDLQKERKFLAHVTNDESADFEDAGKTFYGSKRNPAKSCRDVFLSKPAMPSGNYWIKTADGELLLVTCGFPNRNVAELQESDDISGQTVKAVVGGPFMKEFKRTKTSDEVDGVRSIKHETGDDEFQFVKIENSKHDVVKPKTSSLDLVQQSYEGVKKGQPSATFAPRRTPTKVLKMFSNVQLHATLVPKPQQNRREFQEKPYRVLPTTKVKKRTTNHKVVRSPTEKPFTTHDPTSMFEAMESALHPTHAARQTLFPVSPTRKRTTVGRTRSSTKSVYSVNKHAIDNPPRVNSKLLRIREEDVERPEVGQRSDAQQLPADVQHDSPKFKPNNEGTGEPPKHNFLNGDRAQKVENVNKQIQKIVESERNANDSAKPIKSKDKEKIKADDTASEAKLPSKEKNSEKLKADGEPFIEPGKALPTKPSTTKPLPKLDEEADVQGNITHNKELLKNSEELLKNSKEILKNSKKILENSKEPLKNSKELLENSKEILKSSKNSTDKENPKRDGEKEDKEKKDSDDSEKHEPPVVGLLPIPGAAGSPLVGGSPLIGGLPVGNGLQLGGGAPLAGGLPLGGIAPVTGGVPLGGGIVPDAASQIGLLQNPLMNSAYGGGLPMMPSPVGGMMVNPGVNPLQSGIDAGGTQHIVVPEVTVSLTGNGKGEGTVPAMSPKVEAWNGNNAGAGDLGDIQDEERPLPKLQPVDEIYGRKNSVPATKSLEASEAPEEVKNMLPARKSAESQSLSEAPEEVKNSLTASLSIESVDENAQVRSWQSHEKAMKDKHDFDKQYKNFTSLDADNLMPHLKENQENARTRSWSAREFEMQKQQIQKQYDDFDKDDSPKKPKANDFNTDFGKAFEEYEQQRKLTMENITKNKEESKKKPEDDKEGRKHQEEKGNKAEMEEESDNEYQEYLKLLESNSPSREDDKKYEGYVKAVDSDNEPEPVAPVNSTLTSEKSLKNTSNVAAPLEDKGAIDSKASSSSADKPNVEKSSLESSEKAISDSPTNSSSPKQNPDLSSSAVNNGTAVVESSAASLIDKNPNVESHSSATDTKANTEPSPAPAASAANEKPIPPPSGNAKLNSVESISPKASDKPNNLEDSSALVSHEKPTTELSFGPTAKLDDSSIQAIKTGVDQLMPLLNGSIPVTEKKAGDITSALLSTNKTINDLRLLKQEEGAMKKSNNSTVSANKRHELRPNRNYKLRTEEDNAVSEGKSTIGAEHINVVGKAMNPVESPSAEPDTEGGFDKRVQTPNDLDHTEGGSEHVINNVVKIEEEEQARKRAENDKYDLYKRLQHGFKTDENSKPPNIYVDNRVFIYDGEKSKTEQPYVRGKPGKAGGKGVSEKTYIIDREMKVANEPKVGRVIITTKEPVKKTLDAKDPEDKVVAGPAVSHEEEQIKDAVNEEAKALKNNEDAGKLLEDNGVPAINASESKFQNEANSTNELSEANAKSETISEGEKKEAAAEVKRKPKLITLPAPHNFIIPETKKFSNAMKNLSALENLAQKEPPNLVRDMVSAKGKPANFDSYGGDTVTKSKILPYSGARYHMTNPDAVTAASYVNEIDDLSHGASIASSPTHTQQKNGVPKERQNAFTDMGNNKQDSKAEGTPILIYFTRDKNANVPAIAETHDASSTPSPSKILKNVNKFAKLEKSIIKSMNGKPAQTPILPQLTASGLRTEVTARNFTSEPEPAPMFKSNIKSEIKTVSSVTTKAQVDCCSTVLKKDRASEPPQPVKPMANLTIDEVPGVEKNTITGESKYTSPINQENLPGANVVSVSNDEGSNAEGDPVTIDMQGIHNPISQIASGMQDMIAQAQSSMGNVPGLTNKTKNAESGNGTNDGTNQAREVIPREPADNAEKVQDPPKQINAEKLPFVEKRFQIPTKITKARNCEEKPGKRSHFRKSRLKRSCIQSIGTRKSTTPHNHLPSHKITRRENKEDDLMSFYKSPDLSKENERDDTNSPFASINNPELLEDLVDASRNADISQMRNFHVPTAESIITMPELHVLNLINRSLNTVFNIQTSQLGGTRINNDTRYPITKKQIIKIIRSIEKLHSPKLDENSPSLNYKKISQMAFSTFQKFLARHNASASLLQGDEFPKVQGRYGGGIASERSRDLISEKRLQFGGSRSRKFRQMLLDDIVPNVEKRSSVLRNEEAIQKEGSLKNNSVSENEKTKRELIPSRVGALQPSNLKPLPPVGHDPDEQPFQAVPDALETPSVQPNSSKQQQQQQQQQKQQHNADGTNEEKADETLAEKNREALKSYEEQKAKEEKKESTMETEAPEDQALKNNPSGAITKPQAMSAGTEKPQTMANTDTPQPFRFNWTKLEEEKLLQLQKQLAMSQNASRDTHGPSQQLKQQQNLTGPVEAPAGLNLPSSTASLQNEKQGVNATSQHQFDDDHEVQNSPHNSNNNNKNNNNNNNNGGETHPFEAKMNNSLIASMEERRRNESADANKNKVLHETDPVIHENDKQSEGDGEGSHVTAGESQHNKGNPYENKAELDKNKNVNGQEAQPEQSPPVGEDGKPHADSGPQEHKINEAKAKAPLEPPANATAPDVGETDKGEIGSGGVTSVAKKLKPIQTKPDKTYQDIDTTFEAGLREEEKAREAKAIKMRNNAHQKILGSNNNNNNDDNNINNNNNNNSSISNSIKNNNSLNSINNKISTQKEGNEMKNSNSAPENTSQGEQTVSNDGSKVFHQSRKISFNPENKTQPSSMLITSDATYGPRQNQTKLQIDINPRNSANESTAAAKADAREREIKEMKESLEDLVKQQHTNSKYPHLKLPTKNGDYIGPLDIFDDLGSQPTTSTTSAAAVKSKGTYDDTAINTGEERKVNNDGGPRLQPTRSTQTTTRKQPKIGRISHNYDDDEEFQNIIDSTPTESGGKKTTQTLKQKTTPVLPSKVKEETRKMRENPATLADNKAENGGLNWTMVQELLKKEAQAKEASKANKNEGDNNGDYVPLLANTSDGKSIPLIPIPMDSPLGKLLYPALGQKDSDAATQQTKSNVNNVAPNFANNDDLDLSSLLLESPSKPFNKRAGSAPQNLQNALINKLLQDAKLKAQYTENPLEIAKSQQNKKEVVLLPDKRGLIIAKSNYLSDLGKPMKNTFSVGFNPSKLNTFKDRIPEVIPKLTSGSSYIGESSGNGNAVPVEDNKDNNDGQIHITVQKKNGQLLLIPDQKEALERQMVPQSIKLDLQYKVTQLQKKDQIHSPFHYQTKTFENNDISLRDYSLQKKDLIFSHRKSRAVHRRRRRKNVERHSVRTHSRGWREGEKT